MEIRTLIRSEFGLLVATLLAGRTAGESLSPQALHEAVEAGCRLPSQHLTLVSQHTYWVTWALRSGIWWRFRVISDRTLAMIASEVACRAGTNLTQDQIAAIPLRGRIHVLVDLSFAHGLLSKELLKYTRGDGDMLIEFKDGDFVPSLESQGGADETVISDWRYIGDLYRARGVNILEETGQFGKSNRVFLKLTYALTPAQMQSKARFVIINGDGRKNRSLLVSFFA